MRRRRSKKRSNVLICEELEPRILLSADLVGVAVDPASNDVEQQVDETELQTIEAGLQSVLSNQTDESDISTRELVIIDPATPDYQSLVDDLISRDGDGRSFEIVLLDSSANGIEQLNETLTQYQGLNAIHLISHGGEGEIRLGNATLNQDGLQQSAEQISAWGEALNPGGDWLIYGCDIASTATGERFIEQFAALTGADVAASNDVTGHETLGGDWDLEVVEGSIETDVAVGNDGQEAWLNRLDTTTGLLGHWTLDSNATDSSGNSHNGTLTNGASIDNPGSSNPIGSGNLNLDGFNDFVQLSSHVSAFSGLSEGTIAAWINTADPGIQSIFSISDTADFDSLVVFGMDNGRIFIDVANNGFYSLSVQTNASYADGSWHHVAVTVDGSGNSLYIDGVKVSLAGLTYTDGNASTTNFFSSVTSLDSMGIGIHRDSGGYVGAFDGLQDDVRVYDRALSDSDIAELLSNTAPTFDAAGPPSFTAHTITSSANGAAGVSTVDMDGDGDLDVVSASQNDNKIAWYENDGSQNFTAHTISTSANTAFAVTTADVDGDGDMDVLSASIGDDKIAWYENDGNENFTAHTITLSADIAASVAAADVDGDGDIDVLSASVGDDRVVWYENDGNENFTTRTITSSASGASFVGTVDLDEDGDLDVLSTSAYDGRVAWYENDGNENFTTRTVTTSAYEARQVIAADVDGDGDLDLLSASRSTDKLAWYENNGSESFTLRTITAAAGPVNAVAAADIDNDGDLDVISASTTDDNLVWFENDGSENFTANTIGGTTGDVYSVAVADMDGDGDVDVLATDDAADTVTWYENVSSVTTLDGAPTFVEDGAAVVLDADVDVKDAELDALNSGLGDYNGASLTLVRNGAANSDDVFSFNDGNGITLSGSNLIKSSQIIASFDTTSTAGELVITFTNANGQTPTSADVDNILRQITYSNSNDAPPASVQIDWTFDDGNTGSQGSGGALQAVGSTTVTITAVNDDPTNAGSLPTDITVAENVSSNVDLSAVDFSDVDAGAGTLTVTLTTSTGGNLSTAAGTGITIGGTSTARTLTGTLTDLNNYFNTASNITYLHGTPDTNGDNADTINVTINDNGNTGTGGGTNINLGTVNVDITPDNDVPTITNLGGDNLAYSEDDGAQVIDQGTASVVADVDSSDFDTGTLTVSFQAGSDNAEDVLAIRDQGAGPMNITVSGSAVSYGGTQIGTFTGGSGGTDLVITLDADANATAVTALVRNITYENTDTENPTTGARTVRFVLTDGDGGTSLNYDTTVTVSTVNDAPTLAATAANDTLTENTDTTSGAVFATVTIDPIEGGDDITLAQLTLGGGIENSDTLTINGTAISGLGSNSSGAISGGHSYSYTQATGVVTITFAASTNAAAAELVLESITYGIDPADQNPSTTARTITLNTVTDNGGGSDTSSDIGETATISVGAVNDDPSNAGSLPSDISVTEDVSSNVDLSAVDFSDVDAVSGTLTVTLTTSTGGNLSASAGTGITLGGTPTALTLTGTLSDLNTYFNTASNITYLHGTANTNGNDADTINVTINDNGNTGSGGGTDINLGTVNVDITAVNDAPTLAATAANDTLTENSDTTSGTVFGTVTIDPIETGDDIASAQLTLGGGIENSDTLTINGTAISGLGSNSSGAISGGHSYNYTQATGVVTITFAASTNAAAAELVLESITYGIDPADQNPSTTACTVTLNTVTDNGGGSDTSSDIGETATISVGAVNDDPSNAGSLPSDIAVTEDVSSNVDLSALDFSDVDAGAGTLTVTLTTSTGGDLSAAAGTGITIGGTSTARTLTGTLTDLNNYFNTASNITYLHGTTNTNGNDADTINVTINDNGNTGSGGGTDIDLGTVNVDISAVNDAPLVVGLDGDVHNFTEGDGVVLIEQGGDAVVSDSDSSDYAGGSLTVEVDSGLQPAEDRFSIFNQGTDTGEIGLSGGNVTYSGTLIGTVTGGTGVDPLTVTFNSNATSAAVTALVRNITYENSNLENPADGTRSITIDITDGDGASSLTQNLTLNVSSVNDAPVVDLNGADGAGVDFAVTFTEDGGAVNVVDTDATISDVDNTTYQNLSINLSGFLDGASEQITIAGYVFTYSTSENVIRTVGSTDFEIDFDGTGFDVMLDGGGGMPAADLQSLLRGVTYENTFQDPTAGDRTINFFAQDSSLLSGPIATSTITVNPQNDAPTATDNTNSVSESGFVSGNAITDDSGSGVDSDPEGDGLQVTQVEGGAYTPGLPVTLASGAQVTFQTNGSYTYNTNGQFDGLGASDSVDDNFTYQIGDGNGGFDTATVTITINGSNNTPSITSAGLTLDEGQTVTLGDANFAVTDADDTDFTYTVSGISGGYFQLSTNPGVSITSFTSANLTGGLVQFVDDGNEVAPAFSVTVNDGDIDSNTLAATINFTLVSDSTPVANIDSITVAEGGTVTTLDGGFSTVLNNDTGLVDAPVTVSLVSDVTNGSLTLNGDGTFSYTHDGSENFTDSFTYRVTDNDGQTADATVTINVTPVSDETPVANADSISVGEGGTITTLVGGSSTVLNNDTGLGDTPVTVSLVTDVTNGSLTLNGGGTFSYTHDGSENFTDSFTYRVTDNDGEMADATVTINVTPVSDETPVANADSISVAEGGTITTLVGGSSTVLNNDTGLGDTPVTVSLITDVTNGSLTLNGDGTFSYTHDGSENFTDSFTYRITDNDGQTADATVTINVTPVSDETPVANADSITVAEGGTVTTLVGGSSTVLNNDTGLGDTPVTVSLITDV
ncbi:MAG: FG-GAP-like repeat-containing protein, partial [Candidatus Thiodiazotropha endolucinida]